MKRLSLLALLAALTLPLAAAEAPAPPAVPPVPAKAPPPPAAPAVREIGNLVADGIPEIPARIRERTRQYNNVRGAYVFDWDPDGGGLLVGTRFGETLQVHHVDGPGRARRQLTFLAEPIHDAARDPSRPGGFWYQADVGGREAWQTYWFDGGTGRATLLTDGKSRNEGILVAPEGARFAYSSNRRNGTDFDVWVREGEASKLVFEGKGQWNALDWSPDGTKLLLKHFVSINESWLHVLDVATGKATAVPTGGGKVAFGPAAFAGNDALWLATDEGAEFLRLYRHDLATGQRLPVTPTLDWDVEDVAVSEDQKWLAWTANEGGTRALYVAQAKTPGRARRVELPVGLISDLRFDRAGRRLAFSMSTASSTSDAWVVDLKAMTPARWTFSEVGGLPESTFVSPDLVEYPTFDGRKIPAWVYTPRGAKGKVPVIVSIHGGPEGQASAGFNPTFQYWVNELGAAVIAPNVRGSAGYGKSYLLLDNGEKREDSVKDIGALLDWIATQPGLDKDRVAVIGGSYGGYMVLASLVHFGDRIRCGVDSVGISNFVTFLKNTEDYRRDLRRAEYGDERDEKMRAHLEAISPMTNAARIRRPLLVVQGLNDPRVPASEAEQIVETVRDNGGAVWYLLAKDEGHGFRKKTNRDFYNEAVTLFFEEHLLR